MTEAPPASGSVDDSVEHRLEALEAQLEAQRFTTEVLIEAILTQSPGLSRTRVLDLFELAQRELVSSADDPAVSAAFGQQVDRLRHLFVTARLQAVRDLDDKCH